MAGTSITEKYEYKTLILTSYDGHEQRIKNRQYPRHFVTYDYPAMDCLEAQWLRGLGRSVQNRTFYIPMWHSPIYLQDTFTGGTAFDVDPACMYAMHNVKYIEIFFDDDVGQTINIAREVDFLSEHIIGIKKAVLATLKSPRAWLLPLRRCSVQPMQGLQYIYSDGSNVSYSFEDMLDVVSNPNIPKSVIENYEDFSGWNSWGLPEIYVNKNVFLHTPQWVGDDSVSLSLTKNTNLLDKEIGIEKYDMKNLMSYDVHTVNYYMRCREEINNLVRFFKRVQGRYKAFWLPTWVNDISCSFDINAGDNEILIDFTNLEKYTKSNTREKRIVVFTKDWSYHIFRIFTYGTSVVGNKEYGKLVLASPVTTSIPKNMIWMISYLNCVRLDSDELQLNYETDYSANVQLSFREVDDPPYVYIPC